MLETFAAADPKAATPARDGVLDMFTQPNGVAVVGASASPDKLGYAVLHNVMQYGYLGPIYLSIPRPWKSWACRPTRR